MDAQPPVSALPANMQDQWDAFAQRYVEDYVEDTRVKPLRHSPHTVEEAPQFTPGEQRLLQQRAYRNVQLLHDLAFGAKQVAEVISARIPADLGPQYRKGYVEEMQRDLRHVTEAMADESKNLSYHVQRFTLDRLMHLWVERRADAAYAIGVENFRVPHMGNPGGEKEKAENDYVQRAFNTVLKEEDFEFLAEAIKGLCKGYIGHHTRSMRRSFPSSISGDDIKAEEERAFRRALRLYDIGKRSEKNRNYKSFPSYLMGLQQDVVRHLQLIQNSTQKESDALSQSYSSLYDEDEHGRPLVNRWSTSEEQRRPGLKSPLRGMIIREAIKNLSAAFNDLLGELNWRERQLLTLRLGLEIPDAPEDDSVTEEQRSKMQRFKEETEAIREKINAVRAKKRDKIENPEMKAQQEYIDQRDLPGLVEMCIYFPPLDRKGNVLNPDTHITHQAVRQAVKAGIKNLLRLHRQKKDLTHPDAKEEMKIIDGIYDAHWGKMKEEERER